jgi:hypothetical protein
MDRSTSDFRSGGSLLRATSIVKVSHFGLTRLKAIASEIRHVLLGSGGTGALPVLGPRFDGVLPLLPHFARLAI